MFPEGAVRTSYQHEPIRISPDRCVGCRLYVDCRLRDVGIVGAYTFTDLGELLSGCGVGGAVVPDAESVPWRRNLSYNVLHSIVPRLSADDHTTEPPACIGYCRSISSRRVA